MFPTCSIQVPNGFPSLTPFFNEGITQDGDWKGFGHIEGGKQKREKNPGVGGGEIHSGNRKVFTHHMSVAIENLSVTICKWWLKFLKLPWGHGDWNFLSGNWNFFNRHKGVAIIFFSITTHMWQGSHYGVTSKNGVTYSKHFSSIIGKISSFITFQKRKTTFGSSCKAQSWLG